MDDRGVLGSGIRFRVGAGAVVHDASRAWVSARMGRDTRRVYEFDVKAGRFSRALAVDEQFDIDGDLQVSGTHPASLSWERLVPNTVWYDAEWNSTVEALTRKSSDVVWKPVSLSRDGVGAVFFHCERSVSGGILRWFRGSRGCSFVFPKRETPGTGRCAESCGTNGAGWRGRIGVLHGL